MYVFYLKFHLFLEKFSFAFLYVFSIICTSGYLFSESFESQWASLFFLRLCLAKLTKGFQC